AAAKLSPSHFHRLFKSVTGLTPSTAQAAPRRKGRRRPRTRPRPGGRGRSAPAGRKKARSGSVAPVKSP
ncbi:MAG TPA: AraC family transcriptional regulator, partial [Roseiarcus sp.]|nr:AraC family transcriptional regulator [Roseiarcus sp.]